MDRKVAFISGGTSGLGAAFAQYFAQQGYNLIVTGHPDDKIRLNSGELIQKYGVNIEIIHVDLAAENDILKTEEIIRKNTSLEILVSNAGFYFGKPFWQKDVSDLEDMIKVHISVPVRFVLAALPLMAANKKGIIISISTLVSFWPVPQDSMYSATKTFNNSFMESLHISLKDKGIKVQVLCPGFLRNTEFHERAGFKLSEHKNWNMLPWMDPDRVVKISVRNLKKKNRVVVIPGFMNRVIKNIVSFLPRRLYYFLAARYLQ